MILSPSASAAQSEPGHGAAGGTPLSFYEGRGESPNSNVVPSLPAVLAGLGGTSLSVYEGRGEPADKTAPAASKQPTQSKRAASARARRARNSEPPFDYSAFPESI